MRDGLVPVRINKVARPANYAPDIDIHEFDYAFARLHHASSQAGEIGATAVRRCDGNRTMGTDIPIRI
jgi:hypothetical protein